jgi:hypothetical protein
MSDTPRTDAVETEHGLAWFGLDQYRERYLDGMVRFRELAKALERELASLNQGERVVLPKSLKHAQAMHAVSMNYIVHDVLGDPTASVTLSPHD